MSNTFVSFSGTSGYIGKTGTAGEFFEGNIDGYGFKIYTDETEESGILSSPKS